MSSCRQHWAKAHGWVCSTNALSDIMHQKCCIHDRHFHGKPFLPALTSERQPLNSAIHDVSRALIACMLLALSLITCMRHLPCVVADTVLFCLKQKYGVFWTGAGAFAFSSSTNFLVCSVSCECNILIEGSDMCSCWYYIYSESDMQS